MDEEPFERLPHEFTVTLEELSAVMNALDVIYERLRDDGESRTAGEIDAVISRMTRWIWPVLGTLDDEGEYDD